MPLIHIWDVSFTEEEKAKLQKDIANTYKELRPMLKEREELIWVIFHEVSPENWMVGSLNVKELKQKLMAEKKIA